jgi:WD40 repeat protein
MSVRFSRKVQLHWENGDFERWDTEQGHRLGRVERLPRRAGWCIGSPDEATILAADRMVDPSNSADRKLWWKSFVPSISIWDTKSGARKHLIQVPEAAGYPYYIHQWYARWLDNSRVLLVRLQRENLSRGACRLRLIVIDTAAGKVVKASDEFKSAGEHLLLSPDRKLALVSDDNFARRAKDGNGVEGMIRNRTARTHIFDLERLTAVSSWREPRAPKAPDWEDFYSLLARWCPDGKTVITVDNVWSDGHPSPNVRLWDCQRGRLLQTFSGHKDYILDFALTTTGDKLLTASEDRTVRVWATRTGKLEAVLSGHAAGLNKVVVLQGDKLAVSAAEEPVVKVWDLATGKLKFDLSGHDSSVRELEVVSDKLVRTITRRGTATIWSCSTGKRLQVTPKPLDFPKRFGVCELDVQGNKLQMRIVKQKKP